MSGPHEQTKRIAILCAVAFLAANVVFYFLSDSYFDSHRQIIPGKGSVPTFSPEAMTSVRIAFAGFAGVVALAAFFAGIRARLTAHLLMPVLGALTLTASVASFAHTEMTMVLGTTLGIAGILMPVLAWQSYRHHARPAWAFLIVINGVFAFAELFGVPKVARWLDVSLWITFIVPGLHVVAAFALVSLRREYAEQGPVNT